MKIIKRYVTNNPCYKQQKQINVKGLMLHSVGTPQPKAEAFANYWNRQDAGVCVHAVLQPDGTVLKLLPWKYKAWHCGGTGNDTHIGIEMTEPDSIAYTSGCAFKDKNKIRTYEHVNATYNVAVELFAHLCIQFKLNPTQDGVIVSHREGHARGIASNHGDVEHLWDKYGFTMDKFRRDVKKAKRKLVRRKLKESAKAAVSAVLKYVKR